MKRKVVLTETKLRKVVKNIITEILVNKAYDKFYSDIPEDIYKKLTSVDDTKGKHLGPYAKWVIEIYRNGNFDLNDINKAKEYIDVFESVRVAGKLKGVNINNFESLDDMYNSIKDYLGKETITKGEKIRKKKDDVKKSLRLKYDSVSYFEDGLTRVKLDDKWNLVNMNGELLFKQWFDWVGYLTNGLARVKLDDKWNLVNMNGELLFKQWFDFIGYLTNGLARVKLDDKWSLANMNGEILSDQYFNLIGDFKGGFAMVQLNGKGWNFININGELLSDQWFDWVLDFKGGFAKVELNGKWNFININGEILFKQWFDKLGDFENGFGTGKVNDKFYRLDLNNRTITKSN